MTTRRIALATTAGAAAMALLAAGMLVGQAQAEPVAASAGTASYVTGHGNGAGNGNGTGTGTGTRARDGSGSGTQGGPAAGTSRRGGHAGTSSTATATAPLTSAQAADLVALVEEEKLAGDVYAALAAELGDAKLARIAASEDRHAAALRSLLVRYGIADPTADYAAGVFPTAAAQALYDQLVARGSAGIIEAYAVGAEIERMDIDDLTDALAAASGRVDVQRVYTNLRTGSEHHLAAFV